MRNKITSIKDRVLQIVEKQGVSKEKFFSEIGMTSANFRGKAKETPLNSNAIENIITKYPDINLTWLLTGKGPMITSSISTGIVNESDPTEYYAGKKIRILPITVGEDDKERITLVNTRVAAGYADHLYETEYIHQLPAFNLPMQEFRSGTFRCFQVQGESMAPELKPGSYVIGRYVEDWISEVRDGEVYIVVYRGEQRPVIKRLKNRVKKLGKMILQSDNIGYNTYSVDVDDILEVWRYQAHISFSISKTKEQIQQDITTLKADMAMIMEELDRMKDKQ